MAVTYMASYASVFLLLLVVVFELGFVCSGKPNDIGLQESGMDLPRIQKNAATVLINVDITADNCLDFYVDGVHMGHHDDWQSFTQFTFPVNAKVYAVRGEDYGGVAGICASFSTGELTDLTWKCTATEYPGWNQVGYDDSQWLQASIAAHDTDIPGIDPAALWIWTQYSDWDAGGDPIVYCRKTRAVADPCESSPCGSNGRCVLFGTDGTTELYYVCQCLPNYAGQHCETATLKQVAAASCGATCEASSASSSETTCVAAIDGTLSPGLGNEWITNNEGVGAWALVRFGSYYHVTSLMILQRCAADAQIRTVGVYLSDTDEQELELFCQGGSVESECSAQFWQRFDLTSTISDFIRLEVTRTCSGQPVGIGLREIKVYGNDAAMENCASLALGATCTASSENDSGDYGCENAIDGVDDPGSGNEWASNGESNGAWIQVNLNGTHVVYSVGFLQRCDQVEQNMFLRLDFSDGSSENVELVCFNTGQSPTECDGQFWQNFVLPSAVVTSFVRVEVTFACTNGNNGFREIRVFGFKDVPIV